MTPHLATLSACLLLLAGCELPGRGSSPPAAGPAPWAWQPRQAPAAQPAAQPPWGSGAAPGSLDVQVLNEVNARRQRGASCGGRAFAPAVPLQLHPILTQVARAHSADMASRNFFDHTSPDGRTMTMRLRAAGYQGGTIGENIAAGAPTPQAVVEQWMQSPGHCSNIMDADFRFLGVGFAQNPGTTFGTYWTQDFGS